jgi:hypothetical protein
MDNQNKPLSSEQLSKELDERRKRELEEDDEPQTQEDALLAELKRDKPPEVDYGKL